MDNLFALVWLAIVVVEVWACWRVFEKAGESGWACLIPIYNFVVLLRIVDRPTWWILLAIIPFVNIWLIFRVMIDLAHRFGESTAFGVGLTLLGFIFVPLLAFSDAEYRGA